MKDRGICGPDHNEFCVSLWELETYPEDANRGLRNFNKENDMINSYFRNVAISSMENSEDGREWT